MRELRPNQQRSLGRALHRKKYAAYMNSPEWFRRRSRWYEDELQRSEADVVACRGCGTEWTLTRGDLHHIDYGRLGDEAHADLWALCRYCHTGMHELIESSKSWRKLPRRHANELALQIWQRILGGESAESVQSNAVSSLHDYL